MTKLDIHTYISFTTGLLLKNKGKQILLLVSCHNHV